MSEADRPILIVGGGIGGCAAALALARKGFRSRIIEQAPEFAEIGAGIQFGPNAIRMLKSLGVLDEVNKLALFPEMSIMLDSITGQEVMRIPYGDAFVDRFGLPYTLIHRADLHSVLMRACQASDLVRFDTKTRIVSIEESGGNVTATSDSGRILTGSALIGADGLWSKVREYVVEDGEPIVSGHIAYRAVLPTEEVPVHLRRTSMTLWAGEKTHLVHYPLRGGELFNLVAVFHSDSFTKGWNDYGDAEELHLRFAGKCEEVRTLLGKIESWRMWVLCDRMPVKTWTKGKVTLLGDAAHPMLQYLGQGAASALEDAVSLAGNLEANDGDFAAAAQAYQQQRYLRTGRMQLTARVYGEIYHASGVARELRNNFLGGQKQSYDSVAWLYDYDAWTQPSPGGTVKMKEEQVS